MVPVPLMGDTLISRPWVNDPIHTHVGPMEHHVIAPTLRGDGFSTVRSGDGVIRAPSVTGGVTIAPRGFSGDFDCDGMPLASNVFLSRARLQRCADELSSGGTAAELVPRLHFDDPALFSILKLIAAESSEPGPHGRLYYEQLIDLMCLQLLRLHCAFPAPATVGRAGLADWQVQRVTRYMADRLGEPVSLQELADLLGFSRFHFCKAFRRATGFTPYQWLVRLRMEQARRLLRETRLSITEVAFAVAYQTPSAFTHAFRACYGLTPSEFRRRL